MKRRLPMISHFDKALEMQDVDLKGEKVNRKKDVGLSLHTLSWVEIFV